MVGQPWLVNLGCLKGKNYLRFGQTKKPNYGLVISYTTSNSNGIPLNLSNDSGITYYYQVLHYAHSKVFERSLILMKYKNPSYLLQYCIKDDKIMFHCSGLNRNEHDTATVYDHFLFEFSTGNHIFLHVYRLSDIRSILDPKTIIAKAGHSFDQYFHLAEAKIKSNCFADDVCCEIQLFICKTNVQWEDFLTTPILQMRNELFKNGSLLALFYVSDHGADFAFESNVIYAEKVFVFFRELKKLGWQINKVEKLELPH